MKSPRAMWVAALLGALQASWSVFQWRELIDLRSGGEAFCFGSGGGCASVWESPLASAIQSATGLPVAGWGVAWGLVAAALALLAWWQRANGRPDGLAWSATMMTAAAGVVTVIGLASSLFATGTICSTCALTYVLVLAYAATVFFFSERPAGISWPKGAGLAAAATFAAWLLLLYPGLQTPPGAGAALATIESIGESGEGARKGELAVWVEQLPGPVKQDLANALAEYSAMRANPNEPVVGALVGSPGAPVHITDFSDIMCSHCANLHQVLEQLLVAVPPGRIALEARYFPLDGACNPLIPEPADDPVRCAASRALICIEEPDRAFALASALFGQRNLSAQLVTEIAESYRPRAELEACMASERTTARLQADIQRAMELNIRGTPLVLVNGRRGTAYPPFLYAIAMSEGRSDHPAFAGLPEPKLVEAGDGHEGHGH